MSLHASKAASVFMLSNSVGIELKVSLERRTVKALFCGLLESTGVLAKSVLALPLQAASLSAQDAYCSYSEMLALDSLKLLLYVYLQTLDSSLENLL